MSRGQKPRDGPPEPREEDQVFGELLLELRDGLERAKRLVSRFEAGTLDEDGRSEARRGARYLAVEGRIGFSVIARMEERAPELFPRYASALRVVTRLAYCLLALSGEDPEPLALITRAELDTILVDEGGDDRLAQLLSLMPADKHREGAEQ